MCSKPSFSLLGLAWLLVCQSLGEALVRLLHWRLPGPVIGLLLMLGLLRWPAVRAPVAQVAESLLTHLSLLFVPVGVGVMTHTALIGNYGLRLLLVLLLPTWVGLAVTALVLRMSLRQPAEENS